jgi:predicted Zn-dependent peptidase
MLHTRSATLALCFGTGSRYEATEEQGIAHLVEHMLFKGSARYPTAQSISEAIEGVGGVLNASTDKELTVYWSKVASRHTDLAFDLLSDMVRSPRLDDEELDKEKRVVLEELGLAQDAPGEWVHQLLSETLWPDQPLGREIAGTPETVNSQTPGSIAKYIRRTHGLANAVLTVAGNADPDHVIKLAEHRLGDVGEPAPAWVSATNAPESAQVSIQVRPTEQAYLAVGGYALPRNDPDRFALRLANAILGDGMSSRLFLEVREHLGLAYDVSSYVVGFHDAGALVVAAGVDPDQSHEALDAILREIDRLRQGPVPETELRKVKEYIKGRTWLGLEDSYSVANWYGAQALLSREELSPDDALGRLEAVTADDVLRVTQRVFSGPWLNLAYIGPDPDADRFRERLTAR